ncbi:hypothetical protein CASFOL_031384 [Castilleja foliolosa]|uniref:Gnk2-homologous domain-containing protein n=1 Tax=Castilleja foliolosa TaxID=1961234 RepID=A0ABD3C6G4_9LAMI
MGYYYNMNLLIILPIILTSSLLLIPIAYSLDFSSCSKTTYQAGSNYSKNLKQLIKDLCDKAPINNNRSQTGSCAKFSNRETAYGRALCSSGDTEQNCRTCLTGATSELVKICPTGLQAIIGRKDSNANCQFKYSDKAI